MEKTLMFESAYYFVEKFRLNRCSTCGNLLCRKTGSGFFPRDTARRQNDANELGALLATRAFEG